MRYAVGAPLWVTHSICLPGFLLSWGSWPNNFPVVYLKYYCSPFFHSSDKNKEDEWGKTLKMDQTLCQQCRNYINYSLGTVPWPFQLSQSASPSPIPAPCTYVRQINGFNLENSSLSICGMCVNLLQFPRHYPLRRAVEDKMLWACPSKHTHPISGSKSQHSWFIFPHALLYLFPVTH